MINTKDIDSIDVYRYYPNYEKRTFSIAYENIYNSSKINNDKIVFDNSSIHIKLNQDIFNPNNYSYLYIKIKFKRNMNFDLEKDYLLRAFSYHYPYSILWDSDFELRNKSNDIESLIGGAKIADYENFQTTDISLYNKNRDRINLFLGILFSAFIGTLSSIFIVSLVGDKINFFKK
ncbi:MAG: hypothetical protein HPY60_05340 [Candidatus Methanofastidiosum sp.]|nr:hypothetical protein [Methanofastidiosum sp.]